MTNFTANEEKFAEMILYVCQKCADDPCFGSIKLNKVLCFADFLHYANYGRPITGVEYQKLPRGPAPRRLLPVRERLIHDGYLAIQPVFLKSGAVQKRPVNLRDPNLGIFTGDEVATIDSVIEGLRNATSETVSELSHQIMVGWLVVEEGDTIPYSTIFLSNEPLSPLEIQRGLEVARKHDLVH